MHFICHVVTPKCTFSLNYSVSTPQGCVVFVLSVTENGASVDSFVVPKYPTLDSTPE